MATTASRPPAPPRRTSTPTIGSDLTLEVTEQSQQSTLNSSGVNFEHREVYNDPREWSSLQKNIQLLVVTFAALCYSINGSINFPSIEDIRAELRSSEQLMSAGTSIYFVGQAIGPLMWSSFSEVYGKKIIYLMSMATFLASCVIVSLSTNGIIFLIFRTLSGIGGSAAVALGAGTLVDIYEPQVRGKKLGIYYIASLIGPSAGNLLGGALSTAFDWRASFYFLSCLVFLSLVSFCLVADTFRKERSVTWTRAFDKALIEQKSRDEPISANSFKPKLRDANPLPPILTVCRNPSVVNAQICSGIIFGIQIALSYTSSIDFSNLPWDYSPIIIGCILATYGAGQIFGSIIGGRVSDHMIKKCEGKLYPSLRIQSTYFTAPFFITMTCLSGWAIASGWHIAAVCATFFFGGFCAMWCFTSLVAFQVDSTPGLSTIAVACTSSARGIGALAGVQIAAPMHSMFGQGILYTGWSVVAFLAFASLYTIIYVTSRKEKLGEQDFAKEKVDV